MAYAFDTLVQTKRLREAGFEEKQAEALTAMLRDAVKPLDTSDLVTKADLKAELAALKADLKADLATKSELAALKADLLQWIIGLIAGAVVLNAFIVVGTILGLLRLLGH